MQLLCHLTLICTNIRKILYLQPYSNIAEIFHKTAEQYPDNPALILSDKSWTYNELSCIIAAAAANCIIISNQTPSSIAIIGNNHPAYIVAYFASQCLGATTVELGRHESLVHPFENRQANRGKLHFN